MKESDNRQLFDISGLRDGWDSYDGGSINPTAISDSFKLLQAVDRLAKNGAERRQLDTYQIAPIPGKHTNEGAVQIEWRSDSRRIEVVLAGEGEHSYLIHHNNSDGKSVTDSRSSNAGEEEIVTRIRQVVLK